MDINLKYQYTHFVYPYIIEQNNYSEYLYRLLNDKKCKLRIFEKDKDLELYSYFSFNTRTYMFQSYEFNKQELKDLEKMDIKTKAKTLAKVPALIFDYEIPENIHGKTENNEQGIFFTISKIELIVFNTGICFVAIKTNLEETTKFKDLLQFNYKFKSIQYEKNGIKNSENIKIQSNAFNNTNELMDLILDITGKSLRQNEDTEIFTDKFFTYSYVCVDAENWNENISFDNIKNEFYKFSNILSSDYNNYVEIKEEKLNMFKESKYIKFGFNRSGGTLFASGIDTYNYTKLPVLYEKEYLYTLIINLYQKIYIDKVNVDLRTNNQKELEKVKDNFVKFTKGVWFKEITNDEIGRKIYKLWRNTLGIEEAYNEVKEKYNIIYKNQDLEENKKLNKTLGIIITVSLLINGITFIIYRLLK